MLDPFVRLQYIIILYGLKKAQAKRVEGLGFNHKNHHGKRKYMLIYLVTNSILLW